MDGSRNAANIPPTLANEIPNQMALVGTAFNYAFLANTFFDADGDALAYTATLADDSALPTWLTFSAATRAFSGTPQAADVGTVAVKVTASDGNGESVSDSFDIVVSVAMDTTGPRVASIVRQNPTVSPTNADSLTWRVTFSEAVSNVNAADFAVSGTTATVTAVAVSGLTGAYDVSASGGNLAALNATVTLAIAASHNIEDGASNSLTNTTPTGTNNNSYVVDNTAPSVTISGVPASSDAPFRATFTFSEAVTGFAVGDHQARQCQRLKLHGHEHDGLAGAGHADGHRHTVTVARVGQCGAGCRRSTATRPRPRPAPPSVRDAGCHAAHRDAQDSERSGEHWHGHVGGHARPAGKRPTVGSLVHAE